MKVNCFSVTFWFNIFEKHTELLSFLQNELKDEYEKFNIFNYTNNLIAPIITAVNNKKKTNISFSQIKLQYNMDDVSLTNLEEFKEKILKLFNILLSNNIEVSYTSVFVNSDIIDDNSLEAITNHIISKKVNQKDLIDVSIKLGKKSEDLYYKIVSIFNKKQVKLPKKVDEFGRLIPIPLISWNEALFEKEIIDVSYEINDKYSFDFTKNYHTTEFYLNKMLYILSEDLENDINSIINKGEF